jgi:hypothetical protein
MNTLLAYRKAGLRLAILMFLGTVLMVVARPTKAFATTCQDMCATDEHNCDIVCAEQGLQNCGFCVIEYQDCLKTCD